MKLLTIAIMELKLSCNYGVINGVNKLKNMGIINGFVNYHSLLIIINQY